MRKLVVPFAIIAVLALAGGGFVYAKYFTPPVRSQRAFEDGKRLIDEHRLKEAQIQLRRAVGFNPNFAMAQYLLGRTSAELGDYPRAYQALTKAVELRPNLHRPS